jgi:hypothetical protein
MIVVDGIPVITSLVMSLLGVCPLPGDCIAATSDLTVSCAVVRGYRVTIITGFPRLYLSIATS